MRRIDRVGQRFGMLTVIANASKAKGHTRVQCVCDCGKTVVQLTSNLRRSSTVSCGCVRNSRLGARKRIHGMSSTSEYTIWTMMIQRCDNDRATSWPNYGGRGITVCPQWRASFQQFLSDMGHRPSLGHSIDRKDNAGDYSPDNCRWATRSEQANNRRTNTLIEFNGETHNIKEWADIIGIASGALWLRLFRRKWPIAKALHR